MKATALACLAALMLPSAAHAATAPIGDLTLIYDAARWTVTAEDAGALLSCNASDCAGIRVRLTVARDDPRPCDRRSAYEAARAAFPFAESHAANGYRVGSLYLVLAESRSAGALLDAPGAVSGCIRHGGTFYGFRSILNGTPPPWSAGYTLELLRGLEAPPGQLRSASVGGLAFDYRDDLWELSDGGGADRATLKCLPPTCSEDRAAVEIATIRDLSACTRALLPANHGNLEEAETIRARGGISFRFQASWTGCRNMTPPVLLACAMHRDMAYRIATTEAGCRTFSGVPVDAFRALLESMRPKEAPTP